VSKIVVIYKSKYGATKRYAEWISESLNAPLFESTDIKQSQLNDYDVVVYGGGLYASGIDGVKAVTENFCKTLVLFTVGLADPKSTNYTHILEKTFSPEQLSKMRVFHLRGGIDYKKLSLLHKGIMAFVKRAADKKTSDQRTGDDIGIIETYGKEVNFTNKATIKPLVEYIRTL